MALEQDKRSDVYSRILSGLSGVYAANVQLGAQGEVEEIHLLASGGRSAKQVVRDARSALITLGGLDVDHRKFSVALLKEALAEELDGPSIPSRPQIRLQCGEITQTLSTAHYAVRSTLTLQERTFEGTAAGSNTPAQRMRINAQAVLAALHQYLGRIDVFTLMTVQRVTTTPVPVTVVILECLAGGQPCVLVGAAEATENEAVSVQRATLDAVNRRLAVMQMSEGDEPAR